MKQFFQYLMFVAIVLVLTWGMYAAVNASDFRQTNLERLAMTQRQWHELQLQIDPLVAKQMILHELANDIRKDLCADGEKKYCPPVKVHVTSYNPVHAQTDASPCIGAAGQDLCVLFAKGERPIALSRDLVGRAGKLFTYGDKVKMESDIVQCNGEFVVLDTMAARWTNKADLFFPSRDLNTSCHATISKL